MSRRQFRGALAALLLAVVVAVVGWQAGYFDLFAGSRKDGQPDRGTGGKGLTPTPNPDPNLILILTDDQPWDTLGAMPNVERLLAADGITFTNAFVTTSLCCPSRASILSGQYSRHTGVYDNVPPNGGAQAFADASTLPVWLRSAGYTTALIGKYLNGYPSIGPTYIPPGWDDWEVIAQRRQIRFYGFTFNENGQLVRYPRSPDNYITTVMSREALAFVRQARRPFFLLYAPIAPHTPAIPAPGDAGTFHPSVGSKAPSYNEPDVSDKPWVGLHPTFTPQQLDKLARTRGRILDSLQSIDRFVGSLVNTLQEEGVLDRTVIVFTSDNGLLLGEHRLSEKVWPYEESIRVPLVVRAPWVLSAVTDQHLVLNIDLAPTFAELAGVTPGRPVDGRSLVPLVRGDGSSERWRSAFVVEWLGHEMCCGLPPPFEAIRTQRYLYSEYRNGWRELYDLKRDPYELSNRASDPTFRAVRRSLAARLRKLLAD